MHYAQGYMLHIMVDVKLFKMYRFCPQEAYSPFGCQGPPSGYLHCRAASYASHMGGKKVRDLGLSPLVEAEKEAQVRWP